MRHTTIFGRGGRRRISRWYFPLRRLAPPIQAIRNLAWKVGKAARRALVGGLRARPFVGERRDD